MNKLFALLFASVLFTGVAAKAEDAAKAKDATVTTTTTEEKKEEKKEEAK